MWDLTGTTVAANYRKVRPSTQLGTRKLRFVTVVFGNGGDSDVDLRYGYWNDAGSAYAGSYLDSDSYFSKAVIALQNYGEVWAIGKPDATSFIVVMTDDTAQDSDTGSNSVVVPGAWTQAELNLVAAVGIGNKTGGATAYNGAVAITDKYLNGSSLSTLDADTGTTTGLLSDQLGSNEKV